MCHPEASSRVKVPRSAAIMEMYTIIPICADSFSVNPSLRVFETLPVTLSDLGDHWWILKRGMA